VNPIKTVGDFEDLAHDTADKLWKTEIAPQIKKHAGEVIDGGNVALQMRNGISDEMKELFPKEADDAEAFAKKFDKDISLPKAQSYLELLNAKLKGYYKLSPDARNALGITDGTISAYENAADGLRNEIYNRLEDLGEKDPRGLRQQYGALKEVQRVFAKRATVSDRQAPLNMQQVIGMIAGAAGGFGEHLRGGGSLQTAAAATLPLAVATAAKIRNLPQNLLKTAMSQTAEAAAPSAAKAAVKGAAKSGTAFLGSQAGQGWVKFTGKDGKSYLIHKDDVQAAQDRGLIKSME
jgi:hypothetical protein